MWLYKTEGGHAGVLMVSVRILLLKILASLSTYFHPIKKVQPVVGGVADHRKPAEAPLESLFQTFPL